MRQKKKKTCFGGRKGALVVPRAPFALHAAECGEGDLDGDHGAVHELFAAHGRLRGTGDGADHFGVALFDVGGAVGGEGLRGKLRAESAELVPAAAIDAEAFGGEDFVARLLRGEMRF